MYLLQANPSIVCYYLCMAGHVDGIEMIKSTYPYVHIIASEQFDNDDNVLSTQNEYWADYTEKTRDDIIQILIDIMNDKNLYDPYSKNLAVIFERNRPSNTVFPLYWAKENDWIPIVAREGE